METLPDTEIVRLPPLDLVPRAGLPADRNPARVYLGRLTSDDSRRTMETCLHVMAELLTSGQSDAFTCPWWPVGYQHTTALRAELIRRLAPATVNKYLAALRGVLEEAWKLELMEAEDYHRARSVKNVSGETLPEGRALTPGEITALFSACTRDPSPAGVRDAAILACLYAAGLRRSAVVQLEVGDYNPSNGELRVRRAKGRKARTVWLTGGVALAMADWLAFRGSDKGPLFWPINKGGRATKKRLTSQAIYNMLKKRQLEAGVERFSPHDLRRTFVGDLLDAGADIATVARLAGHSKIDTTARYDRRREEVKRRAAGLLHVPYTGRPAKDTE